MGFARLAGGRTTVIVDAAARRAGGPRGGPCLDPGVRTDLGPPAGDRQLRVGRLSAPTGAGRAGDTSHSTLALEGYSSSRLGRATG
jgi:hypothetical protein